MSFYTRDGDGGSTSLYGEGRRISKASTQVEAYGTLDEASAAVSYAADMSDVAEVRSLLCFVASGLMKCSSLVAASGSKRIAQVPAIIDPDIEFLESQIDEFSAFIGALEGFVIFCNASRFTAPSAASSINLARTVIRRAERRLVALLEENRDMVSGLAIVERFVNRSSDAVFACACLEQRRSLGRLEYWNA